MRKNIIAANWKMNLSLDEGIDLVNKIMSKNYFYGLNNKIIFLPSHIHLYAVGKILTHYSYASLGAQNFYPSTTGAVTGEISAKMLSSIRVKYVLIGHSERRKIFTETNELLVRKIDTALENGIMPIFCCGEDRAARDSGKFFEVIKKQISEVLFHLGDEKIANIIVAYEPIWAIGSGIVATSSQVQEVHSYIREIFALRYDRKIANIITILYGGSCTPHNVASIFSSPDVDGFLVGGSSLDGNSFCEIIENSVLSVKNIL